MKPCRVCGSTDIAQYNINNSNYICRECRKKESREIKQRKRASNPEYYREKEREYSRNNIFSTWDKKGNRIKYHCNKRPHTLTCELCKKEVNRTVYHHWDDTNPGLGMWLCLQCHMFAEQIEHGIHEIDYLSLRDKIIKKEI